MLRVMGSEVRVDHYGAFCDPTELTLGKSTVKKQNVENEREGHWAANAKIHYYTGIIFFTLCADYNGKIAISVYDAQNLEGYQVKGTAQYVTVGEVVSTFKAMVEKMFNGAATAKGALVITPEKVIVTTPGADNKKEL